MTGIFTYIYQKIQAIHVRKYNMDYLGCILNYFDLGVNQTHTHTIHVWYSYLDLIVFKITYENVYIVLYI